MPDLRRIAATQVPAGGEIAATAAGGAKQSIFALWLIGSLWLALVIGGAVLLNLHAATPGQQGDAAARWPSSSSVVLNASGATLLVFVHPYCPCARATLGELAAILATCRGRVTAQVLFVAPRDENTDWTRNELWRAAQAIPDVRAVADADAVEATRFGAQTSGWTLLFSEQGDCLFSGGITAARGHAGDNAGRQAIVAWLANEHPKTKGAPTFGCPLLVGGSKQTSEEAL